MIITIWGNNGSGKSTLAIKLANSFTRMKKNVVLIDADFVAPQVNVWYPKLDIRHENSLAVLLDNNIDNVETIVGKIAVISDNLGVLGYAKDYSGNMIPTRNEPAISLFERLPEICDVVIVDCRGDITGDILSYFAVAEKADERIIAITPDLKGLSWYDSNVRMFEEKWANENKHVTKVFNKTQLTAPISDIEHIIGTVDFYLPYDSNIEKELFAGTLGLDKNRLTARKYTRIIDSIADDVAARYAHSQE